MKITAISAGLAALILGCNDNPAGFADKREFFITPNSIAVSESIDKEDRQKNALEWCKIPEDSPENGWASLKYWPKDSRERVRIYARGTLTNPKIYKICPDLEGTDCVLEGTSQFPFFIQHAINDWKTYCLKFDCNELEEKWKKGEYIAPATH